MLKLQAKLRDGEELSVRVGRRCICRPCGIRLLVSVWQLDRKADIPQAYARFEESF